MVKQFRLLLAVCCLLSARVAASGWAWLDRIVDSALNLPAIAAPMVTFSPETDWAFGGAAQGYFRCDSLAETSMVQLTGAYTLNKQWYLRTKGTVYAGRGRTWLIQYDGGYRNYPDLTYPAGNRLALKTAIPYNSCRGYVRVSGLCPLGGGWSMGPQAHYLYERTDSLQPIASMLGFGGVVQYDTRDGHYYPRNGLFFRLSGFHYESLTPDLSRMGLVTTDLRQYIPLYRDLIFAWQLRGEWSIGTAANRPFQLLPALGGEDLIRGVRMGMFRDDTLWALQGELRFPLFWLFGGAVFAGAGDVYHYEDWKWQVPKVGYGLGVRLKINQANINVRLDLARNNMYKSWTTRESYSFYLAVSEAF